MADNSKRKNRDGPTPNTQHPTPNTWYPLAGDPILGSVWWCDGSALSFEAYFKRRPVLVVSQDSGNRVHVMPLSSKRRFGQEQMVTHDGGISFMTGAMTAVSVAALQKSLGVWAGFENWQREQERIVEALEAERRRREQWKQRWARLLFWKR
jgi:mRNA-degrading endonuclease toxin of MazEF toxin-antitoxin module